MTALPKPRLSEEEYLSIEQAAEYKSEFWDGEMYAMAGAALTDLLFVAQDRVFIEHWSREPAVTHVWTSLEYSQLSDCMPLVSLQARLALTDTYENVDFSTPSSARSR